MTPTQETHSMTMVFVSIGLSLDGYMAPEGMTMENPEYKTGAPSGVH